MDGSGGVFGSGKITCRWFNMPFIAKILAAGSEVCVYGKAKEVNGRLMMDHPEFEVLRDDDDASIHLERIVPIYKNVPGIAQRRLRGIMSEVLRGVDPATLDFGYDVDPGSPRARAYSDVHFPDSFEDANRARRRFALEDFFQLQLNVGWRRIRYGEQAGRVLGKKHFLP